MNLQSLGIVTNRRNNNNQRLSSSLNLIGTSMQALTKQAIFNLNSSWNSCIVPGISCQARVTLSCLVFIRDRKIYPGVDLQSELSEGLWIYYCEHQFIGLSEIFITHRVADKTDNKALAASVAVGRNLTIFKTADDEDSPDFPVVISLGEFSDLRR